MVMRAITKANLPAYVESALARSGIDSQLLSDLPLIIVQSRSIEFVDPLYRPDDFLEMVVMGRSSGQAIRASRNQVNVFAFSSTLLAATVATQSVVGAATLLLALLGACSISLTPEQAAFFVAAEALEKSNTIPTANAFAKEIDAQLQRQGYSSKDVLAVAQQLQQLGVPLTIGDPPNNIIKHKEWTVSIPGF